MDLPASSSMCSRVIPIRFFAVAVRHFDPSMLSQRLVELRNLVPLRQIGIEVVLAGKNRPLPHLAVQRQRGQRGKLHRPPIQHRQRPRQPQAHRADVRIRRRPEPVHAPAERLRLRQQLDVDLEPDDRPRIWRGFPAKRCSSGHTESVATARPRSVARRRALAWPPQHAATRRPRNPSRNGCPASPLTRPNIGLTRDLLVAVQNSTEKIVARRDAFAAIVPHSNLCLVSLGFSDTRLMGRGPDPCGPTFVDEPLLAASLDRRTSSSLTFIGSVARELPMRRLLSAFLCCACSVWSLSPPTAQNSSNPGSSPSLPTRSSACTPTTRTSPRKPPTSSSSSRTSTACIPPSWWSTATSSTAPATPPRSPRTNASSDNSIPPFPSIRSPATTTSATSPAKTLLTELPRQLRLGPLLRSSRTACSASSSTPA